MGVLCQHPAEPGVAAVNVAGRFGGKQAHDVVTVQRSVGIGYCFSEVNDDVVSFTLPPFRLSFFDGIRKLALVLQDMFVCRFRGISI